MPKSKMKSWSEITSDTDSKWSHFTATMENGDTGRVNSQSVETLERYIKAAGEGFEFDYTPNVTPRGTNLRLSLPAPKPAGGKAPYTGPKKDPARNGYWEKTKPEFDEKVHSYHLDRDQKIEHQFYVGFAKDFYTKLLEKMEKPKLADVKKLAQAAFDTGTDIFVQVKAAEAEAKKEAQNAATDSTEAPAEVKAKPNGKPTIPPKTAKGMSKANVEEFDPFAEGDFGEGDDE